MLLPPSQPLLFHLATFRKTCSNALKHIKGLDQQKFSLSRSISALEHQFPPATMSIQAAAAEQIKQLEAPDSGTSTHQRFLTVAPVAFSP